jgi:hypothetical protein
VPWAWIGDVTAEVVFEIVATDGTVERVAVNELSRAWRGEAV